jgi:hypothetical protein
MTSNWIAQRLNMGTAGSLATLLRHFAQQDFGEGIL